MPQMYFLYKSKNFWVTDTIYIYLMPVQNTKKEVSRLYILSDFHGEEAVSGCSLCAAIAGVVNGYW